MAAADVTVCATGPPLRELTTTGRRSRSARPQSFSASWCAPCVADMPASEAVKTDVGGGATVERTELTGEVGTGAPGRDELADLLAERFGVEVTS